MQLIGLNIIQKSKTCIKGSEGTCSVISRPMVHVCTHFASLFTSKIELDMNWLTLRKYIRKFKYESITHQNFHVSFFQFYLSEKLCQTTCSVRGMLFLSYFCIHVPMTLHVCSYLKTSIIWLNNIYYFNVDIQ